MFFVCFGFEPFYILIKQHKNFFYLQTKLLFNISKVALGSAIINRILFKQNNCTNFLIIQMN